MYSRYIPGPDGVYRRQRMEPAAQPLPPPQAQAVVSSHDIKQQLRERLPGNLELGDLLVLLIALLLLIDEDADLQTVLLTAAAFFFL